MRRGKGVFGFVLLILLATVPAVNAATVTYTGSYSGLTDVTNQLITVSQFDPSMGTLLSVEFELDATMNTSMSAVNDGDFYAGWDLLEYEFSLTGDTGYESVAISASNAPVRALGTGTADGTFAYPSEYAHIIDTPNSTWTYSGPALSESDTFSEAALAAFVGTGDLSFFLTTSNYHAMAFSGLQTGGVPSPATTSLSTTILANVSVTYEFAPVPLPAAIWLFGPALVGILRWRKRP